MMTPLQALEMLAQFIIEKDDDTDFSASVIEAHNEIKKALTPPTADEVCELNVRLNLYGNKKKKTEQLKY